MGREWELSYRLGMRKTKKCIVFCLPPDACPEESKTILSDLGKLSRKRRVLKNFKLPESSVFLSILHLCAWALPRRTKLKKDIYLEFIQVLLKKQEYYEPISNRINKKSKCFYRHKKSKKLSI